MMACVNELAALCAHDMGLDMARQDIWAMLRIAAKPELLAMCQNMRFIL